MATISMHSLFTSKPITKNLWNFDRKLASKSCCVSSNIAPASIRLNSCSIKSVDCDQTLIRRSANYKPPIWDFDYIQSLNNEYTEERYYIRACELKTQVNMMLEEEMNAADQLELIDNLQRLGICHHFEDKIKKILTSIHEQKLYSKINYKESEERDLYYTALEFRLLRQHGYSISQEIFDCFKTKKGDFKLSLGDDTKGLLQLYEASYLLTEGEYTLEVAREFAKTFLKRNLVEGRASIDQNLSVLVQHTLELPLHWRVQRLNARWFIDAYGKRQDMNPVLVEFAKLSFNILQARHQQELKDVSRWWKSTCLAQKLPFARDRLVEWYFCNIGCILEPQDGYSRIMIAKVYALITIIDDTFDVYGTLEELHHFNDAIQRWDIESMDQLPKYMQLCFLALNNFVNEMAYDVLKEQGLAVIPYLRKLWKDLFKSYLQEAEWYSKGYTPTLEEYINNAWITIASHVMLCHAFFLVTNPTEMEAIQSLYKYHDLIRCTSIISRLANDLGTSPEEMERGDISKSIQCYMKETGASREEAREYVRFLIDETWKKMNKLERGGDHFLFQSNFIETVVNVGRMSLYVYQHGDGHGNQNHQIKERMSKLLFEPINIEADTIGNGTYTSSVRC